MINPKSHTEMVHKWESLIVYCHAAINEQNKVAEQHGKYQESLKLIETKLSEQADHVRRWQLNPAWPGALWKQDKASQKRPLLATFPEESVWWWTKTFPEESVWWCSTGKLIPFNKRTKNRTKRRSLIINNTHNKRKKDCLKFWLPKTNL